jgi:hypothetical protein
LALAPGLALEAAEPDQTLLSSSPWKAPEITMPFETWKGRISSSKSLIQASISPGWILY